MQRHRKKDDSTRPNWLSLSTLVVSVLGFIISSTIAIFTYRLDSESKQIQSHLNDLNAKMTEFKLRGTIDYRYSNIDMRLFCDNPGKLNEISKQNIDSGFAKNEIWQEAKKILDNGCQYAEGAPPDLSDKAREDIARLKYSLAYIEFSKGTDSFIPRPKIEIKKIPISDGHNKIWQFAELNGQTEFISLGEVNTGVKLPVALLDGEVPRELPVIIPLRAEWFSPGLQSTTGISLSFILNSEQWQSIRVGWVRSGA